MTKMEITPEQQFGARQSQHGALLMAIEMLDAIADGFNYDSFDFVTRLNILKEVSTAERGLTYANMADTLALFRAEVKRRNPLFVNAYIPLLKSAEAGLREISAAKIANPGSDEA